MNIRRDLVNEIMIIRWNQIILFAILFRQTNWNAQNSKAEILHKTEINLMNFINVYRNSWQLTYDHCTFIVRFLSLVLKKICLRIQKYQSNENKTPINCIWHNKRAIGITHCFWLSIMLSISGKLEEESFNKLDRQNNTQNPTNHYYLLNDCWQPSDQIS